MNIWEKFAREDAEYYILTYDNIDYSTEEGQRYFYASGVEDAKTLLERVESYLTGRKAALEIGCGIGRLTLPHARIFEKVSAVDVAPTMLTKLAVNTKKEMLSNITGFLPHEQWDAQRYDYVYSLIVFQHITDYNIIRDYITRISRAMNSGATAQLQFDTRPSTLFYRIRNLLPDFLLPRAQRRSVRRIRRKSSDLRSLFKENGLEIMQELAPDSEGHIFLMKKK
jgi:2-polyprenyl-3-methyl-5-hydroxy-6-metoxy-1,4-benzoquinol methylase